MDALGEGVENEETEDDQSENAQSEHAGAVTTHDETDPD
jgi:hypothetical protein